MRITREQALMILSHDNYSSLSENTIKLHDFHDCRYIIVIKHSWESDLAFMCRTNTGAEIILRYYPKQTWREFFTRKQDPVIILFKELLSKAINEALKPLLQ